MRPPQELLYDSEASYRLVDSAIEELNDGDAEVHHEVSPVTETTTDILDGLGRAVSLVEQLDSAMTLPDNARHQMAASLREELSRLLNHPQFQDTRRQ